MLALALRVKEPTFRDCIENYVAMTCRRYHVRDQDVDDLVQDSLTKIVTSIDSFRPEKGEFEQWAKGVALNVIRRYLRDAKRYFDRFSEYYPNIHDYPSHESSPERCAQRKQARSSISNALKNLTAQQASVVVSFDLDDMSYAEIGADLGISAGASQQCHERALNNLARCIPHNLLSVMPLSLAGCDEPVSFNEPPSRQVEQSHYRWQGATAILAVLFSLLRISSTATHEPKTDETRVLGIVQNNSMYRYDEPSKVLDEPPAVQDAPCVKPEPTFLPSVRNASTPAKLGGKLPTPPEYVPRLSRKHEPSTSDHRPNGL